MRGQSAIALFHYLALRAFAHETEDPEKVREALRRVGHAKELRIEETSVEGSHKNRILILEAQVKSAPSERALFEAIARDDPRAFARLDAEMPRRIDEHLNLFLRLDKQEAFAGRMRLATDDDAVSVRGKIRSFPQGDDPRKRAEDEVRAFLVKAGKPKA